ncbi:L-aspartate oxidase [Sinomonas halotolerans]|uniref:L-aspartate oxidase n=1 Tax=Sinomonas halotolerans TaxID=1644133 RepID=A0ABU9WWW5_9MICC
MTGALGRASARRLVVVGSGVAGLVAAIRAASPAAASGGAPADVVLLTKGRLEESNSMLAQGGIAAVLPEGRRAPGDAVAHHIADTLAAGAGHGSRAAAEAMCGQAARTVDALTGHGVVFDRGVDGRLALGLEAAHSFPRILHVGGDASGAGITRALVAAVRALEAAGRVRVVEGALATELILDAGRVAGLEYVQADHGAGGAPASPHAVPARPAPARLDADAVLLATGGAGRLYARTTNPAVATGDGVALAFRAGALLRDLEFYQFHPTALETTDADGRPRSLLVSEAVRGAGAVIRDGSGRRFVSDYHPLGELAPRDAVSRALALHARSGHGPAFLDATALELEHGAGYLSRRFPGLDAMTRAAGFDWRRDLLPIAPAAHYWMGGVATDLDGATSIPGLYAAGEAACTGVHGANRLASNSLLEAAVFAARAVDRFLGHSRRDEAWGAGEWGTAGGRGPLRPAPGVHAPEAFSVGLAAADAPAADALAADVLAVAAEPGPAPASLSGREGHALLAAAMESDAGVLRDAAGLARLAGTLRGWHSDDPETRSLLTVGRLVAAAAAAREESLGAHCRLDFPERRFGGPGGEARIDVVRQPALAARTA